MILHFLTVSFDTLWGNIRHILGNFWEQNGDWCWNVGKVSVSVSILRYGEPGDAGVGFPGRLIPITGSAPRRLGASDGHMQKLLWDWMKCSSLKISLSLSHFLWFQLLPRVWLKEHRKAQWIINYLRWPGAWVNPEEVRPFWYEYD